MDVIVENISREILEMNADNRVLSVARAFNYEVDFKICVDGTFIDSRIRIEHNGDLSFGKAEEIIKGKFLKVDTDE